MFSALKKLARSGDERCPAPMPMSSSLQKKFSKGVHFNMKILIKGDRNVGKSCLLQRLQGGPFIEDYVPTDQIQVAPIHWTYKNTDYIVKVEVWEVVDKGRTKKKPPLGLKLENQTAAAPEDAFETPILDATFLDVYKNATGVILMFDITKPWTFEYVVKELSQVPADLPVAVLGNHCDMQHHRQVHTHHIQQALYTARQNRTAPVRYAESSMRNGFGLRLLHKFLSVPFLRLQRATLLEQLQRNQQDMEDAEKELDDFQNSEEAQYNLFVDRLANKRKQSVGPTEPRPSNERAPSIVLGAGKPIVPPSVNPLLAQSLNPTPPAKVEPQPQAQQSEYVNAELINPKHTVSAEMTPPRLPNHESSVPSTPMSATNMSSSSGALDEFYAGTLDTSFLEELPPAAGHHEPDCDSDSDEDTTNPKVIVDQDDIDIEIEESTTAPLEVHKPIAFERVSMDEATDSIDRLMSRTAITNVYSNRTVFEGIDAVDNDFPLWAGDSSARRSPEGGEDPDPSPKEPEKEKKKSKKKSKDKDRGDYSDKSEKKDKKHKKKSKSDKKTNPQQGLLVPSTAEFGNQEFNYEEYDSI